MADVNFKRRTLSESVEQTLREMILNGDLHPGDRVNEAQLAEDFAMSRGPIREALRRLETEGLIIYRSHKGTFVKTLSKKDAFEIYTLRGFLEGEAVKLALPYLNEGHIEKLQKLVYDFEKARVENEVQKIVQNDLEFHHMVVERSHHGRLYEAYKRLDTQLGAMFITIQNRAPSRFLRVAEIHQDLVDALKTKDEKIAEQAFRAHYTEAWNDLKEQYEDS